MSWTGVELATVAESANLLVKSKPLSSLSASCWVNITVYHRESWLRDAQLQQFVDKLSVVIATLSALGSWRPNVSDSLPNLFY